MDSGSTIDDAASALAAHLRERHGIEPTSVTPLSVHREGVYRVDRKSGPSWVARVHPAERPADFAHGDVTILRLLERLGYPAERPAATGAVSDLDGAAVVVTEFVSGDPPASGVEKIAVAADLLGRLHTLDASEVHRPGGAAADDPLFAGAPSRDVDAALDLLDAAAEAAPTVRPHVDRLRELATSVDSGDGLPEALVHGNLLHDPDHFVMSADGPIVINWASAGLGPRLADLAFLVWAAEWGDGDGVAVAVDAYRRHVEVTADELDRLEAVMLVRPLYLTCVDLHRAAVAGEHVTGDEWWWNMIDPAHIARNAAAARAAFVGGSDVG